MKREELAKLLMMFIENEFPSMLTEDAFEEAKFVVERLKVQQELKAISRPFDEDRYNYVIRMDHEVVVADAVYGCQAYLGDYVDYYFDDEKSAEDAIRKIGRDRIKRYLFGIKN